MTSLSLAVPLAPLAPLITAALIHFVWQGAAIGLITVLALSALQRSRASTRYAVLCAALAALIVAPIATLLRLALAPSLPRTASEVFIELGRGQAAAAMSWAQRVALPLWIGGVCVLLVRVVAAYGYVALLRRRARSAAGPVVDLVRTLERRMRVRRRLGVGVAAGCASPSLVGWLRPVLLLPVAVLTGLTPAQLEAIIAHEIAHVRRHDYLVNMFQLVAETFLFYHPVTWWLSARLREERELCCDDIVVEVCGDAVVYARALAVSERLRVEAPGAPLAALGANDGPLMYRIRRLLAIETPRRQSSAIVPLLVACALAACVGSAVDAPRAGSGNDHSLSNAARHELSLESLPSDGGMGKSNQNENGEAAFAATMRASRSSVADTATHWMARLVEIQLSGVSRAVRDRMNLPVQIGDTITVQTKALIESRLRAVDSSLDASVVALEPGRAALLIAARGR